MTRLPMVDYPETLGPPIPTCTCVWLGGAQHDRVRACLIHGERADPTWWTQRDRWFANDLKEHTNA